MPNTLSESKLTQTERNSFQAAMWVLLGMVGALVLVADLGLSNVFDCFIGQIPGQDKTLHFCVFGGLAIPVCVSTKMVSWKFGFFRVPAGVAALLVLTSLEELSQIFLSYRTFDLIDLICNWAGVLVFGALTGLLYSKFDRSPRPAED